MNHFDRLGWIEAPAYPSGSKMAVRLRGVKISATTKRRGPRLRGFRPMITFTPFSFGFEMSDRTSGAEFLTNENTVSTDISGVPALIDKVFLSETQTTPPASTDPRFTVSIPGTFALSNPDGLKTVYLWAHTVDGGVSGLVDEIELNTELTFILAEELPCVTEFDPRWSATIPSTIQVSKGDGLKTLFLYAKDAFGNITNTTDQIFLLDTFGANFRLDMRDLTSGSMDLTDSRIVSTQIVTFLPTTELNFDCFLSETQTTAPATNDIRFMSTIPVTFELSATPNDEKEIYLWCRNVVDGIQGTVERIYYSPFAYTCDGPLIQKSITTDFQGSESGGVFATANNQTADIQPDCSVASIWRTTTDGIAVRVDDREMRSLVAPKTVVSSTPSTVRMNVVADWSTGGWTLVYIGPDSLNAQATYQRFDRDFDPIDTSPVTITGFDVDSVSGGIDEAGNLTIAYNRDSTNEVFFQQFDNTGSQTIVETLVETFGFGPRLQVVAHKESGNFVVGITKQSSPASIRLWRYQSDGMPAVVNPVVTVDTSATGIIVTGVAPVLAARYGSEEVFASWRTPPSSPSASDTLALVRVNEDGATAHTPVVIDTEGGGSTTGVPLVVGTPVGESTDDYSILVVGNRQSQNSQFYLFDNATPPNQLDVLLDSTFSAGLSTPVALNKREFRAFGGLSDLTQTELLATTNPITITLSDTTDMSTYLTDDKIIDVTLSCPVSDVDILLSETQLTAPATNDPLFTSVTSFVQTTFCLTTVAGPHTVYMWTREGTSVFAESASDSIILKILDIDAPTSDSSALLRAVDIDDTFDSSAYLIPSDRTYDSSALLVPSDRTYDSSALLIPSDRTYESSARLVDAFTENYDSSVLLKSFDVDAPTYESSAHLITPFFDIDIRLLLRDRTDGSTVVTNERTVSTDAKEFAPGVDLGDVDCFISETQTTTPGALDTRFISTVPSTFELSAGNGKKDVYLWCVDNDGAVQGTKECIYLFDAPTCLELERKSIDEAFEGLSFSDAGNHASAVADSGRVLSVWTATTGSVTTDPQFVYGRIDSRDEVNIVGTTALSTTGSPGPAFGAIAVDACNDPSTGNWIVAHVSTAASTMSGPWFTYYRRFDNDLNPLDGSDVQVAMAGDAGGEFEVAIDCDDSGRFTLFYKKSLGGAHFQRFTSAGAVSVPETALPEANFADSFNVVAHRPSGRLTFGYIESTAARVNRFDEFGAPLVVSPSVTLGMTSNGQRLSISSRYGENGFFAAWAAQEPVAVDNVKYSLYSGLGIPQYPVQTLDTGTSSVSYPAAAFGSIPDEDDENFNIAIRTSTGTSSLSKVFLLDNSLPPLVLSEYDAITPYGTSQAGSFDRFARDIAPISQNEFRVYGQGSARGTVDRETIHAVASINEFMLSDMITGDTVTTTTECVSVDFDCITLGVNVFLSETQTTAPTSTDPRFAGFPAGGQTIFCLSTFVGLHTVYAWYNDEGNVNSGLIFDEIAFEPETAQTFTHVLTSGTNLISPALELSPNPLRAGYFLQDSIDTLFYLDASSNLLFVAGFEIVGNPGDPSFENDGINIRLEAGKGYLVNPVNVSLGQIRTVSFTGMAFSD